MPKFYYIVFEGIDGAGKSTQIAKLSRRMKELNLIPILLSEPTQGQYGLKMRELKDEKMSPDEQKKHFTLDRKEHIKHIISPLMKLMDSLKPDCGLRIIQSRTFYCSPAYQGIDEDSMIKDVEEQKLFSYIPDIVFLLDIPAEEAMSRREKRGGDQHRVFEKKKLLSKARQNYLFIAGREKNFKILDASKSVESVHKEILDFLQIKHFKPGLK